MTISKTSFDRFSIATQIFGTLVAGSVLIAGIDAANAHGSGGGGGGGSSHMGSGNSGFSGGSSHMNNRFSSSGKSNRAIIEKQPSGPTRTLPILTKGNGNSKGSSKESRRELRKEYKKELKKEIAQLKKLERCKVLGKCGGISKPIGPQPVGIGKLPPQPGGGTTVGILGPGTGNGGGTTGGGMKPPTTGGGTTTPTAGKLVISEVYGGGGNSGVLRGDVPPRPRGRGPGTRAAARRPNR